MPTPYNNSIVNGATVRVPWLPAQANLKLRQLKRDEVIKRRRMACAKAREVGLGHLVKEMKDGTFILDTRETIEATDKTPAQQKINMVAVQIKGEIQNGHEITDAYRREWVKFCSGPRDPSMLEIPPEYQSKAKKGERLILPAGMTVKPTDEKPKRINQRRSEKL